MAPLSLATNPIAGSDLAGHITASNRLQDCLQTVTSGTQQLFRTTFDLFLSCGTQIKEKIGVSNLAWGSTAVAAGLISQSKAVFIALVSIGLSPGYAMALLGILQLSALAIGLYLLIHTTVQRAARPNTQETKQLQESLSAFQRTTIDSIDQSINRLNQTITDQTNSNKAFSEIQNAIIRSFPDILERAASENASVKASSSSSELNFNERSFSGYPANQMISASMESYLEEYIRNLTEDSLRDFHNSTLVPLQNALNEIKNEINALQQTMKATGTTNEDDTIDINRRLQNLESQTSLSDLSTRLDRIEDSMQHADAAIDSLQENRAEQNKKIAGKLSQLQVDKSADLQKEIIQIREEIDALKTNNQSNTTGITKSQTNLSDLLTRLDRIEDSMQHADAAIDSLQETIRTRPGKSPEVPIDILGAIDLKDLREQFHSAFLDSLKELDLPRDEEEFTNRIHQIVYRMATATQTA